jgi:hypothetical protein
MSDGRNVIGNGLSPTRPEFDPERQWSRILLPPPPAAHRLFYELLSATNERSFLTVQREGIRADGRRVADYHRK